MYESNMEGRPGVTIGGDLFSIKTGTLYIMETPREPENRSRRLACSNETDRLFTDVDRMALRFVY